jgi:hypothetical protein
LTFWPATGDAAAEPLAELDEVAAGVAAALDPVAEAPQAASRSVLPSRRDGTSVRQDRRDVGAGSRVIVDPFRIGRERRTGQINGLDRRLDTLWHRKLKVDMAEAEDLLKYDGGELRHPFPPKRVEVAGS